MSTRGRRGATTWYKTVGAMQEDLETYLKHYNRKRAQHEGQDTVRGLHQHPAPDAEQEAVPNASWTAAPAGATER